MRGVGVMKKDKMKYLAHIDGKREQSIKEHLEGTAVLAAEFAKSFRKEQWGYCAGMLHDIGKYSEAFQERIRGNNTNQVDHSTAGAKVCMEKGGFYSLLGYCIAGHHAGLPNTGAGTGLDKSTMYGRLKKNKKKEKEEWYLKKAIQEFFIQGNCINYCETIRDFDGWSWNNSIKSVHDMEINLVFQNIMMLGLKSEDFENASYVHLNSGNELYRLFYIIILTLIAEKNENMKMQIINRKKVTSEMLDLMKEKVAFLNKITEEKKSIFDEIRRIDEILNDKEKLRTEYYKRNSKLANKDKIFSVSFLADIMENEREEKMKELKELNEFLDPRNYAVKKQIIENENYVLETVVEDLKNSENKHTTIISLQENFLYEFSKKIEKNIENKESLRSLIYEFRYYCLIPISKKENISDVSEIRESIQKVMNTIIDNSIDKELITNFSNSTSLCYTILKHIFETKIIDLEEIKIKINNIKEEKYLNEVKNKIAISIYDSKETESIYEETVLNLKQLNVRINKKIPLFL